jgi:NADH-quinone oxidoreductase subunit L
VIGGLLGLPDLFHVNHLIQSYLSGVVSGAPPLAEHVEKLSSLLEFSLLALAGGAAIVVILFAKYRYITLQQLPTEESSLSGIEKLIYHKFYVDELYEKFISQPVFRLSEFFSKWVDKFIIDQLVNGSVRFVEITGKTFRLIQTGNTGFYVFAMVIGMVVLFIIRLLI